MSGFRLLCNNNKARIFVNKNFVGVPKATKSTKISVLEYFRLYGMMFNTYPDYIVCGVAKAISNY